MDQHTTAEQTKTSKTNGSQPSSGQRPAASSETRIDPEQAHASPHLSTGLVRLSDGTVASASDEALTLIIAEATALTQEAQGELDARAAKREAEFLEMVRQQALVLGVTPARLAAAIAGKPVPRTRANGIDLRSVVRPKYRDPSDPTRTWSGRGNAPPWIELDSATGKPLPTFHIPEGEQ